jgi:predicted methyltransferase
MSMETPKLEQYFSWSDAWVFTALYFTGRDEKIIDFGEIIATGDALNHAIFSVEEIRTAFIKLQSRGVVQIGDNKIRFTELGKSIIEKAEKVRGGVFSRVDISLKKLNSNRTKLPYCKEINDCSFITQEIVIKAYKKYIKKFKDV